MAIHIHPLRIPSKCYKPIGQIVVGWNLAEALISSAIWHLHGIRNPKVGRLFTQQSPAVQKLKVFKVTLDEYVSDPAVKTMMQKLYKEAESLRAKRNTYVHALWGRMPKDYVTWKIFYSKDQKDTFLLRRDVVTFSALTELAASIHQLNKDLKKLLTRIGAPPP